MYSEENPMVEVQKAHRQDVDVVTQLALQLWSHHNQEDLKQEMEEYIVGENSAVFLAMYDKKPVGFAQWQKRVDYVEGTQTSPVGYLEGIFVLPEYRRKRIAQKLVSTCEAWTLQQGCCEFASDCPITNEQSFQFHMSCGFQEANRIICFYKKLK